MYIDTLKNLFATTASISSILQFLTGAIVCRQFIENKSTGDQSALPFICGCVSTFLWARYGFLVEDTFIILVNTIGATLFFCYVVVFFIYSIRKSVLYKQFMVFMIFLCCTLFHINSIEYPIARFRLGLISTIVTIMFFATPLVSLMHVLKVRNTESLPFPIILSSFLVSAQWLMYGLLIGDKFVQIPNFLGCVLTGIQLGLFCCFSPTSKGYTSEQI